MTRFLARRAVASVASLLALIVMVFFLQRLTGDPTLLYLPVDASLEAREQFRHLHGFDDPLMMQFFRYIGDMLTLDFGTSIRMAAPALDVVLEAFQWTLTLALVTLSFVAVAAIGLGSLAAFNVGGIFDRIATFFSLIGASAPDFWVAIVAIVFFALQLDWLPTSGTGTIWHWILPVAVLFIRPFGLLTQVVRGSMITTLSSDYVKTARAKGIRPRRVIFVHSLRNGMLPVITVLSDQATTILNGAVVVETIFGFPGVGNLMIESILARDFTVVLATIIVTAFAIFIMNILVDITYAILDPRIRY